MFRFLFACIKYNSSQQHNLCQCGIEPATIAIENQCSNQCDVCYNIWLDPRNTISSKTAIPDSSVLETSKKNRTWRRVQKFSTAIKEVYHINTYKVKLDIHGNCSLQYFVLLPRFTKPRKHAKRTNK